MAARAAGVVALAAVAAAAACARAPAADGGGAARGGGGGADGGTRAGPRGWAGPPAAGAARVTWRLVDGDGDALRCGDAGARVVVVTAIDDDDGGAAGAAARVAIAAPFDCEAQLAVTAPLRAGRWLLGLVAVDDDGRIVGAAGAGVTVPPGAIGDAGAATIEVVP